MGGGGEGGPQVGAYVTSARWAGLEQGLVDSGSFSSLSLYFIGVPGPIKNSLWRVLYFLPHTWRLTTEDFCTYAPQPLFFVTLEGPPFPSLAGESYFQLKYFIFSVNYSLTSTILCILHLLPQDTLFHLSHQVMDICLSISFSS